MKRDESDRGGSSLLAPWTGPYGGVPPLSAVKVEDFEPALLAAMDLARSDIAAIAESTEAPTFDNVIAALEHAGKTLDDVETLYGIWSGTMNGPEFQAVERKMAPVLAGFSDEVTQNAKLFARVEAVFRDLAGAALTPEQKRLVTKRYRSFVRAGARLDDESKKRLSAMNLRLASLYTTFSQNVLADEENEVLFLADASELEGLPESFRSVLAAAAADLGKPGQWAVANTRSSVEPFLTYSARPDLREKVWRSFVTRGESGGERDNHAVIAEILALRTERARLLGYATHAHWRLEDAMAKTPERAMALLESVWPAAVARVHEEVRDMQALAANEGQTSPIEPWDYRYYAEKVRRAKYDIDENEVKPYLELESLREAMFWVAGELFGFVFTPVADVPVYHPDVRVWEVKDRSSGRHVGLWYFDPYARAGKQSGAWMASYRKQERVRGDVTPLVSNNANFVKGAPGEPVLISWTDARTLFHEFGHALHGLASDVTYPMLSGTSVPRDYVEFPSQLLEHWLATPEVLGRFAHHHRTGEPIPKELVAKIERAATFNQGFDTVEYLASALVDMKLHLAGDAPIAPRAFEEETLTSLGMPREIVMRHRTAQFSHVFSGDAYSAGYYSYLWADTLTADAYNAFLEGSGPYDRDVAARLRRHVFAVGDTIDPAEGYRAFRGRDVDPTALMRKRGFAAAT